LDSASRLGILVPDQPGSPSLFLEATPLRDFHKFVLPVMLQSDEAAVEPKIPEADGRRFEDDRRVASHREHSEIDREFPRVYFAVSW
jgi:hypothetical protein